MKSAVRDQEGDLQEQLTFLANEKDNLTELERLIKDLVNANFCQISFESSFSQYISWFQFKIGVLRAL